MSHSDNLLSHEELVDLLSRNEIDHLTFIMNTDQKEEYLRWCDEHGVDADPVSAEFYCDYVDVELMYDPIGEVAVA